MTNQPIPNDEDTATSAVFTNIGLTNWNRATSESSERSASIITLPVKDNANHNDYDFIAKYTAECRARNRFENLPQNFTDFTSKIKCLAWFAKITIQH